MSSACTDALCYLGLGHVFPANMTGNTVLLGIGLATGDRGAAARSATALGAFLLGAAVAGAGVPDRPARRAVVGLLGVEIAAMAAFCAGWLTAPDGIPVGAARFALIALAGGSMGMQSGLVRALGVPVSTTYITGTWTSLSAGAARHLRRRPARATPGHGEHLGLGGVVVATYLTSASGAALAFDQGGAGASPIPLLLLLLVTPGVARGARRRRRLRPPALLRSVLPHLHAPGGDTRPDRTVSTAPED